MADNPWRRNSRPLAIAHRGHSIELPENTTAAYLRAIDLGVDMIECDVNLTRDGELVMIHDVTLDRTTNGSGRVGDFTLAEIRELDAGAWRGPQFAGLRVPTASETIDLARAAGISMCFEVKGDTAARRHLTAIELAGMLRDREALGWALVSSFDHDALGSAKSAVPELRLAPERLPDNELPPPGEGLRQARALEAPVLQNQWRFMTQELVESLHDQDIALWLWSTSTEDQIRAGLRAGADGLMGDDAVALVRLLRVSGTARNLDSAG